MEVRVLGGNHSIIDQYISEIRCESIQKDPLRFRENLQRLGELFAYEISKEMKYTVKKVKTPLGIADVPVLIDQPVLASILRAGLLLHQGLLHIFDRAENCFISAFRKYDDHGGFSIESEYFASPSLHEKTIILSDPMLATGASLEIAYRALLEKGTPSHVHIVSLIASRQGLNYLKEKITDENVNLWLGAIDEEMTYKSYIVPGLGDAGDLAYGPKLD